MLIMVNDGHDIELDQIPQSKPLDLFIPVI